MVQRLPYADEEEQPDPRGELLDGPLEVDTWEIPGRRSRRELGISDDAPSWWRGDEDASQSFFKAMGIDPRTVGGPAP